SPASDRGALPLRRTSKRNSRRRAGGTPALPAAHPGIGPPLPAGEARRTVLDKGSGPFSVVFTERAQGHERPGGGLDEVEAVRELLVEQHLRPLDGQGRAGRDLRGERARRRAEL